MSQLPTDPNTLVDERAVSDYFGVDVRTIQRWRWAGGGPKYVRVNARVIRYRVQDLWDFSASHLTTSTSAVTADGG